LFMTTTAVSRSLRINYSVLAFFLVAANLRPALTNVGPLLEPIRSSLGLSSTTTGLLTALPLPIFACFAPFARLGFVLGIERTLAGCLALIAVGIALRSEGSVAALFGGTAVFAVGIGIANVLMPSVIKRDFPDHVGSMTTAYVMVMSLAGAAATGLSVPLSIHLSGGWRASLAIWAVFAVFALLCWLPEAYQPAGVTATPRDDHEAAGTPIWRSALAWQVTLFMGLQFLVYYVTLGWVPLFLADQGMTPTQAGWLPTLYQVMAFCAGLVAPALLRYGRDQRATAVLSCVVTAVSICALLLVPQLAALWLFVLGGSFGISFILAFAFIGLRAHDHRRATALSVLSQAIAYLIAAAGPPVFGWLHDLTAHWTVPMASLATVALVQAFAGLGAGRSRYV
jgi:CP family cyanate transporter-like MFS transporter